MDLSVPRSSNDHSRHDVQGRMPKASRYSGSVYPTGLALALKRKVWIPNKASVRFRAAFAKHSFVCVDVGMRRWVILVD